MNCCIQHDSLLLQHADTCVQCTCTNLLLACTQTPHTRRPLFNTRSLFWHRLQVLLQATWSDTPLCFCVYRIYCLPPMERMHAAVTLEPNCKPGPRDTVCSACALHDKLTTPTWPGQQTEHHLSNKLWCSRQCPAYAAGERPTTTPPPLPPPPHQHGLKLHVEQRICPQAAGTLHQLCRRRLK